MFFPASTASPASKKQRLGGDDYTHTSYGSRHDEDGHVSTFAINYDDADFEDDPRAVDDTASPSGIGGSSGGGASSGGAVIRKSKNKPWKVHRRVGGGSMHDANLYRHYRPDFRELAREYPGKETAVQKRGSFFFSFFVDSGSPLNERQAPSSWGGIRRVASLFDRGDMSTTHALTN